MMAGRESGNDMSRKQEQGGFEAHKTNVSCETRLSLKVAWEPFSGEIGNKLGDPNAQDLTVSSHEKNNLFLTKKQTKADRAQEKLSGRVSFFHRDSSCGAIAVKASAVPWGRVPRSASRKTSSVA